MTADIFNPQKITVLKDLQDLFCADTLEYEYTNKYVKNNRLQWTDNKFRVKDMSICSTNDYERILVGFDTNIKNPLHGPVFKDFTSRTVTGSPKSVYVDVFNDKWMENEICNYIINGKATNFCQGKTINDQGSFDEWHTILCETIVDLWNQNANKYNTEKIQFGKAQKIINMMFKYLYVSDYVNNPPTYEDRFKWCHMPLDSFTLEWYKDINGPEYTWSNLIESEYSDIQKYIRNYLSSSTNLPSSPFKAEFYIWPFMQYRRSVTDLMKAVEKTLKEMKNSYNNSLNTLNNIGTELNNEYTSIKDAYEKYYIK